ncbi:unnamed protein product, partial [marine sediment metagenome]
IHSWDEEGQQLIGKVVEIMPFTHGKFDTEVQQYILDTDEGRVSTVLGAATDKQIAGKVKPGTMVAIVFRGQKQLADSRSVNRFEVSTF